VSLDASVVVVCYNRARILEKCLECLFLQDYPPDKYEVVYVDDGSDDDTAEVLDGLRPECGFTRISQPRSGQGIARNRGVEAARGEAVIFVDSDAFAPPWFVREHVASHRASPGSIVDGPAINMESDGVPTSLPFRAPQVRALAALDFGGASFITVNASCPRERFVSVGGFDPDFHRGWWWEDVELGARLRESGLGRVKNRSAYVLHYRTHQSGFAQQAEKRRQGGENAMLYYSKHPHEGIKREIRWRYLRHDHLMQRLGLVDRYLRLEYMEPVLERGGPWASVLKKLYMVHAHAEGLRSGMAMYGVDPDAPSSSAGSGAGR